jgi:nitroimidazol reductase NimA-like FMN-containing flavoprotein (pyridoxamine 5'-phosphate oxidase superfamily)
MAEESTATPRAEVRRRDRAVTDEAWIRDLLRSAPFGTLATVRDGQPFVNMNIFVYDETANALYMHTARAGRTRGNVEAKQRVCFGVSTMGRLLPAPTALHFSVEYAGVVVFGRATVVEDEAEAGRALQQLLDKYAPHLRPGRDYRPIQPEELAATSVYRIDIEEWSGKQKVAPADHPGAFLYGQAPSPA